MPARFNNSRVPITDANGKPVPGAKIYTYAAGTSTPKDTYTDAGRTTPGSNPIVCDAGGRPPERWYAAGAYKLVYTDANDVLLWTDDEVQGDLANETAFNMQVFTASGTFIVPTGVTKVKVRCWGAGGGGGGAGGTASSGCGGLSGGYTEGIFEVTPGQTIEVTVGTGGFGGPDSGGAGGNGGTSSFGAFCSATGGQGGPGSASGQAAWESATPGVGSGGHLNLSGSLSYNGYLFGSTYVGSAGASAPFGSGVSPIISFGTGFGGCFPGGGGSGAAANGAAAAGGAGANGLVIVEW